VKAGGAKTPRLHDNVTPMHKKHDLTTFNKFDHYTLTIFTTPYPTSDSMHYWNTNKKYLALSRALPACL
jgi:hypothetical protein